MSQKQQQRPQSTQIWKYVGIALLIAFVGSILWSMWVDTLRPLIQAGDPLAVLYNLIGLPLILIGTGIFVYGGYVFVRDTFSSYQDQSLLQNAAVIRAKPSRQAVRAARWQTLRHFWRTWKPGLARLALGFILIALGGFLINL